MAKTKRRGQGAKASTSSPPKKQKTEDEEDMIEFEPKLVDLDINFADPEVQPKLRSSKSSRRDFFVAIYDEERFWERGRMRHPQHCRRGKCSAGDVASSIFSLTGSAAPFAVITFTRWFSMNLPWRSTLRNGIHPNSVRSKEPKPTIQYWYWTCRQSTTRRLCTRTWLFT